MKQEKVETNELQTLFDMQVDLGYSWTGRVYFINNKKSSCFQ